jgi:hypothetical protein
LSIGDLLGDPALGTAGLETNGSLLAALWGSVSHRIGPLL